MIERGFVPDTEIRWMDDVFLLQSKSDHTTLEQRFLERRSLLLRVSALNASVQLVDTYKVHQDQFSGLIIRSLDAWISSHETSRGIVEIPRSTKCAEYFKSDFAQQIDRLTLETLQNPEQSFEVKVDASTNITLTNKDLLLGILTYSQSRINSGLF